MVWKKAIRFVVEHVSVASLFNIVLRWLMLTHGLMLLAGCRKCPEIWFTNLWLRKKKDKNNDCQSRVVNRREIGACGGGVV